jgi:ribose transport system permease protein
MKTIEALNPRKAGLKDSSRYLWIWSVLGSVVLFILLSVLSGKFTMESLITLATSASFLAIVAIGQMLVITTGEGAIDLSVSSVITLTAFYITGIANGSDGNLWLAILVVLLAGVAIGLVNSFLVLELKIPAIIATLGVNYIISTIILLYNKNFRVFDVAPLLKSLVRCKMLTYIPLMVVIAFALVIFYEILLKKTRFGKSLLAVGQNREAAALAGIHVKTTQMIAYVMCSVLAAISGILISARVGGAFFGLGDSYQMQTVACVVVGGTLIAGGRAVPIGTYFGALFLILLSTAMQVAGLKIGMQNVITGLFIVAVLFLSQKPSRQ